jgi:predicted polyphosphate/ATP-dependent NAD kinase
MAAAPSDTLSPEAASAAPSDRTAAPPAGRVGLIVNPIAGMGGAVALKGTDGRATLEEARRRGARPVAPARAGIALSQLAAALPGVGVLAAPGAMGADVARACGVASRETATAPASTTSADDTKRAAAEMVDAGVDLILFAGGDGTARDIHDVVGTQVPMLGIPTGVKMHSAVFATTPRNAGELAARHLGRRGDRPALRDAEVMDIDEEALRAGHVSARLHGYARTPHAPALIQQAKARRDAIDEAALDGACRDLARHLEPGRLYIIGPGTTTQRLMGHLGLAGTLLGVDAVRDGRLMGHDLSERQLLDLTEAGEPARIIVGVVGGQGFLFGRGNQQISAEVLRRIGRDNIVVLAPMEKLAALDGRRLLVDTGDAEVDRMLAGYVRVLTAVDQYAMMKVAV